MANPRTPRPAPGRTALRPIPSSTEASDIAAMLRGAAALLDQTPPTATQAEQAQLRCAALAPLARVAVAVAVRLHAGDPDLDHAQEVRHLGDAQRFLLHAPHCPGTPQGEQ